MDHIIKDFYEIFPHYEYFFPLNCLNILREVLLIDATLTFAFFLEKDVQYTKLNLFDLLFQ